MHDTSIKNKSSSSDKHVMNTTAINYQHMMKSFQEYMMDDTTVAQPKLKKS